MALVSMRQLPDHAAEHAYGVSAFYVQAAEACNSPVPVEAMAAHYAQPMRRAA